MKEDKFDQVLKGYEKGNKNYLITVLQEAQNIYGFLSNSTLERIGKYLSISLSEIYGVVTFYAQFYLQPQGKYTIKVCHGTACHVKGAELIMSAIQEELKIKPCETTGDLKWTLEVVACLGTCFLAPVIMINKDYYGKLTAESVKSIIASYNNETK